MYADIAVIVGIIIKDYILTFHTGPGPHPVWKISTVRHKASPVILQDIFQGVESQIGYTRASAPASKVSTPRNVQDIAPYYPVPTTNLVWTRVN